MTEKPPPASQDLSLPQSAPVPEPTPPVPQRKSRLWLWITLGVVGLLIVGVVGWYFYYFHASIRPVNLDEREREVVQEKIEVIETAGAGRSGERGASTNELPDDALREMNQVKILPPEREEEILEQQREDRRTLVLTQREINGMLNHNTNLGERLKFDLRAGYIDIQYVQPIPQDVAMVGGQTWRFSLDVSLNKVPGGALELTVRDISVGGIPLPSAWLEMVGIQKNEDLIELIKREMPGFEKFEQGIDYVDISSGQMKVRLAE